MSTFKYAKREHSANAKYFMKRFNRLLVIGVRMKNGILVCDTVCDCGKTVTVRALNLYLGQTKSCGCLRNENKDAVQRVVPKDHIEKIRAEYEEKKLSKTPVSYADIASRYGVSRQRIAQIIRGR